MKKTLFYLLIIVILGSCSNSGNGELVGVNKKSKPFYQPDPYGMAYIPMGSYTMGGGDEDILYGQAHEPKTISVSPFYMDETEITNDEYREFIYWVRDSIARTLLGEALEEDYLILENDKTGEIYDPPFLNWKTDIDWNGEEEREVLEEMFLPEHERYFRKKQIDTRKLFYEYYWIDLHAAASRSNRYTFDKDENGNTTSSGRYGNDIADRSAFVKRETINVYPDTLAWIHDYTYSFNDPMTKTYFWHPAYNHYPVIGVTWKQARAFCIWRTQKINNYLSGRKGVSSVSEFRLPTEAEWEWAARGGFELNAYPWGGPYGRNHEGCFLANYKPLRGNYIDDGGLTTVIVAHYPANEWGLYDMSGNVAEWTSSAYNESSYNFTWDLNPDYTYNAKEDDAPVMKRKVIRGGSWKDIGYYLQVSTRAYEYQDSAKCYIGFRCIQPFLGRQKGDNPSKASRIYN